MVDYLQVTPDSVTATSAPAYLGRSIVDTIQNTASACFFSRRLTTPLFGGSEMVPMISAVKSAQRAEKEAAEERARRVMVDAELWNVKRDAEVTG